MTTNTLVKDSGLNSIDAIIGSLAISLIALKELPQAHEGDSALEYQLEVERWRNSIADLIGNNMYALESVYGQVLKEIGK